MDKEQMALEELKIIQDVIYDQEAIRFKIKGWAVALITAISIAFLSKKINFSSTEYLFTSVGIVLLFFWTDVIHRIAQDRAQKRALNIERFLRGETEYDGPKVSISLSRDNTIKDMLRSAKNVRVYFPYLVLLFILFGISASGYWIS